VLFIFCNPPDNFDVGVDGCFASWLILVRHRVLCCWLSWPLNRVVQSGGTKLTYILMVAICNLHVELYSHFTVKQTYENVLNNVVKVTDGLWPSLI
jgi:hypothetical protein